MIRGSLANESGVDEEQNLIAKLTAIIQSRRLTLFGHVMRMDDNADAKRILLAYPRQTGEDN